MSEDIETDTLEPEDNFNAAEPNQVNKRQRKAKRREQQADNVLKQVLSTPDGRAWIYQMLSETHVFNTSYTAEPFSTAFKEGERNIGLKLLNDIMRVAPDAFTQMLTERNKQ